MNSIKTRAVFVFATLLFSTGGFSQEPSKWETIRWIVKKMKDYGSASYGGRKIGFECDDDKESLNIFYSAFGEYDRVIEIPLKDIQRFNCDSYEDILTLYTAGKVMAIYTRETAKDGSGTIKKYSSSTTSFAIGFNFAGETNLKARMSAAIQRLFTFYPAAKEAF